MKIVCSSSVLRGREAFHSLGDVQVLRGREITAEAVRDASALVIRSTTTVDAALLQGSRVQFVGTATAGTDHLDIPCLEREGIAWCAAPGCNANSVSEYVTAALLAVAEAHALELAGKRIAIVGVGHVGREVHRKMDALGLKVLLNDPPRADVEGSPFLPLEEALGEADIVSLHVPLTRSGPYPTHKLANHRFFEMVKPGCIFVNAARGEVVDPVALQCAMDHGIVAHTVLDVWDGEPFLDPGLLRRVDVGTPHIAGYSYDGRLRGTQMVYEEACRYFEVEGAWGPGDATDASLNLQLDAAAMDRQNLIRRAVAHVYDVETDAEQLRDSLGMDAKAAAARFVTLRLEYPDRREFPSATVFVDHAEDRLVKDLRSLGFQVVQYA